MATRVQVVIDCADPYSLVDFWAAALGYTKEFPNDTEEERQFLAEHPSLVGTAAAAIDPEWKGPRIFFQKVPEPKTVKNRVHLDLNVPDMEAEVGRLKSLGATVVREPVPGELGEAHTVMADPEGNEFCVQVGREFTRPEGVSLPAE